MSNAKLVKAAFSEDVLQAGNNSDVIDIGKNSLVVLRVVKHEPAQQQKLADVKDEIKAKLVHLEETKLAKQTAQKTNPTNWTTKNKIGRFDKQVNQAILTAAFDLPVQDTTANTVISLPNGDAVKIEVLKVHPGEIKQAKSVMMQGMENSLASGYGQADYDFYVKGLRAEAKIKLEKPD